MKPLEYSSNLEGGVKERMTSYEEQLSMLILKKLPKIIQKTANDINDQEYLFHHLDQLIKQMTENLQDFRLQPLSLNSISSQLTTVKLITLRRLLDKSYHSLCLQKTDIEEHTEVVELPLMLLKKQLETTE